MGLNFINSNDSSNSIQFVSSNDISLGAPIYYKKIGEGPYTLSGPNGNKTIIITSISDLETETSKNYYINFSSSNISSNNYLCSTLSSGSVSIENINTFATSPGTASIYDFEVIGSSTSSDLNILPEYIVSKKISGTPNSYVGIKYGHLNLSLDSWDNLKDYAGSNSGLVGGTNYYLSSTAGEITTTQNNFLLFKALSRNRVFVNLTYSTFNWSDSSSAWKNSDNIDLATGKTYKINGTTVLSSSQVLGKGVPTGTIVGTNDSQNLTNKTINGFTYPTSDGTNGSYLVTNSSGTFSFQNVNFITDINMSNGTSNIDISSYSYHASSFKITNPGTINLINGVVGRWYTFIIVSDGTYAFGTNMRFPIDNAQPIASASGAVDIYSFFCVSSNKFISTFAYGYSGVY
jgi:hypothetical protein